MLTSHIFTSTTAVAEERPREGKEGPPLDSRLIHTGDGARGRLQHGANFKVSALKTLVQSRWHSQGRHILEQAVTSRG